MASPTELSRKVSIHDWANALEDHGQLSLAELFREDRAAGFEAARNLGSPTPQFAVFRPLSLLIFRPSMKKIFRF